MTRIPSPTQVFRKHLGCFLLFVTVFLVFVCLGCWQLHRYDEKNHLLKTYARLEQHKSKHWTPTDPIPCAYEKRNITGHFILPFFFLDNQYHNHHFGYHVLGLFELTPKDIVLVDRGFIPKEQLHHPNLFSPQPNQQSLEGYAYYPSSKQWTLGAAIEYREGQMIVERLDPNLIAQALQKTIYPFIIREYKKGEPFFIQDWKIINMPPKQHLAYAFQWFALSGLTLILYIVSLKRL